MRRIWRVTGHGDHAGVEASVESADEIQSCRIDQERSVPRHEVSILHELDGDGPRTTIELVVADRRLSEPVVAEECVSDVASLALGPVPEDLVEGLDIKAQFRRRDRHRASLSLPGNYRDPPR